MIVIKNYLFLYVLCQLLSYTMHEGYNSCERWKKLKYIERNNKSCQKTTTLARQQQSLKNIQGLSFSEISQSSGSRSQGQTLWYRVKDTFCMFVSAK